jgi:hypothetical protein
MSMTVPRLRDALATVLVLVALGTGPAFGQSPAADASDGAPLEQFAGTTYVGTTSDPDLFVAVVVGDDGSEVRAYLCDDSGVSEWFTGTTDGTTVTLVSAPGGGIAAAVGAAGVTGDAILGDGTSVMFEALPAVGVAGLYTSVISADRRVHGTSSAGGTLEGIIAEQPLAPTGESVYPLLGFLTPPDGTPVGFVVTLTGPDVPDETRSIVLNDGQQRGRSKSPGRVWVTDPMALPIQDGTSNT